MTLLHGYDISGYNSSTAPSADFVFVKATEGSSYTSASFAAQWKSAKSRARVRGAYHFARPEQSSYKAQADRFLDVVQPSPGEPLWLDLEASKLTQSATNTWARNWGDYIANLLGEQHDVYLGSGYASNGTGRDLAKHFRHWWYPQYPAAYQVVDDLDIELHLAQKRSSLHPERMPIAATTSSWPSSVSPWLPSGLTTGWTKPHIWQFTDNFGGLDASVTALTLDQLAAGGQATPTEEDMPFAGQIPAGKGAQVNVSFPRGSMKAAGFVCDNSLALDGVIEAEPQPQVRYAFHRKAGTWQTGTATVGSADGGKDHTPKLVVSLTSADDVDYASFVRLDDGTRPVGWDMS
jgi:hypothetical protein